MSLLDIAFNIDEASIDATGGSPNWRGILDSEELAQQERLPWWLGADHTQDEDFFILHFINIYPLVYLFDELEIVAINNFELLPLRYL
jgi:hypothetical protein